MCTLKGAYCLMNKTRGGFAVVVMLALLIGSSSAQEPTPAFAWHNDPAVALPPGAMALADEPCFGLFAEFGLFSVEPKSCYLLVEGDGAAEAVLAAFQGAGYAVDEETALDEVTVRYSFTRPDLRAKEVVILLESDGSVFVLGYQEAGG